jgi:hypothetical protein
MISFTELRIPKRRLEIEKYWKYAEKMNTDSLITIDIIPQLIEYVTEERDKYEVLSRIQECERYFIAEEVSNDIKDRFRDRLIQLFIRDSSILELGSLKHVFPVYEVYIDKYTNGWRKICYLWRRLFEWQW